MTNEEIKSLDLEAIEKRKEEIRMELTDATTESLDALEAELNALESRKAELVQEIEQRKKDTQNVVEGRGRVMNLNPIVEGEKKMDIKEIRNSKQYIDAYANYIKTGNDKECRAVVTELAGETTYATGGRVAVPDFVYDIVKTAWDKSDILSRCHKTFLKGVLKVNFEDSATNAQIHQEGDVDVEEEALILGIVEIRPQSFKKWISISDEVYDLAGEAFLRYIYEELAYKITQKIEDEIVTMLLAENTTPSTTHPGLFSVESTIELNTIATALAKLSAEAKNPVIIMNRATWSLFKGVQYEANYPVDPFEGLPVLFSNAVPDYDPSSFYILVGDLEHSVIVNFPNGEGIDFKFDEYSQKKRDLIEVLGREYVGIGYVAPDGFVKVMRPTH